MTRVCWDSQTLCHSEAALAAEGTCFPCHTHDDWFAPVCGQVLPGGVVFADQGDLLFSRPAFDFGFAGDGVSDVLEGFVLDQAVDSVFAGEGSAFVGFVAEDAGHKKSRYAYVEDSAFAGHYVDVVAHVPGFYRC
jgi:hypothetical protein